VDERDGHVSQSSDVLVSVPRIPDIFRSGTPVEIEEEIRLGGNLPTHYHAGMVGGERGDGFREARRGRVYLRGGTDKP